MRLPFVSRARDAMPEARAFPFVELVGGDTRVLVLPTLGGKIAELWMGGRQWLWQNPHIPLGPSSDGEAWAETGDSGGFDECVPTVGGCRMPGWVRGLGGVEVPEHGELWSQVPDVDIRTSPAGQLVRCTWTGRRLPYQFGREVRVDHAGTVHLSYAIFNTGTERMPFVWAASPTFPLSDDTRLILPEGSRLRVYARHGIELGETGSEHRWPHVRGSGKVHDFTAPGEVARRYACKLFLDVTEGAATLREPEHELRISWDALEVPNVGIWINRRGWTPFRDQEPYLNLGIHPGIGAPDTLVEALGDWKGAAWLDAGETRRWELRMSASRIGLNE